MRKTLTRAARALLLTGMMIAPLLSLAQDKEKKHETSVWGYLVDDMTGAAVPGAKVTIMLAKDSTVVDTLTTTETNAYYTMRSYVSFTITEAGEYLIKAEADGYETTYNRWSVPKLYKHEDHIRVTEPWYIRRPKRRLSDDQMLGTAVVRASRVKFYYKGDTLVYNADAFELAEGSMLDALIKQLPGVELKQGGEITVQGRRVDELLINGRDFLNGDRESLLENLPTYMVKNIKVFEKNDRERALRGDTLIKNLTMDVRLKKEYSTTLVGNAEAGLGTNHTAMARLFGLRLAPKSSFKFHFNANNVNEARDPGEQGDWSPMQQAMSVYDIYRGGLNYHHSNDKIYYANMVRVWHTDNKSESHTMSENFLSSGNTFGRSYRWGRHHSTGFSTNHTFYTQKRNIKLGPIAIKNLHINPVFDYGDNHGISAYASATAQQNIYGTYGKAWRDSIAAPNAGQTLRRHGINRAVDDSKSNGYSMHTSADWNLSIGLPHDDRFNLWLQGKTDFTDSHTRTYDRYNLQYLQTNASDYRNRHTFELNQGLMHRISIGTNNIYLTKRFNITPQYTYTDHRERKQRTLYLLNKLDAWGEQTDHAIGELPSVDEMLQALDGGNSYRQQEDDHVHDVGLQLQYNTSRDNKNDKVCFAASLKPSILFARADLRYERGALDTLLRRSYRIPGLYGWLYIYPNESKWPTSWFVRLDYLLSTRVHDLSYLVDYRDDSNPLNIMLGNPNLRNAHTHDIKLEFTRRMKKQRLLESSVNAHIYEQQLAMGYTYDTQTGVRTVMPSNVNGNWDITGRLNYSARLDEGGKLTYSTNTDATFNHSVDIIEALRSVVKTTNVNETLRLSYRASAKASVNFKGALHWQHATSAQEGFSTINVADFDYGVGGVFHLPLGLQLSTDLTMYSRRGYNDHSMNTDELVWNARLSRHFAKSGITVLFDAFDLLGNLSNVRRTINAQGRTETWYNVTPHYAMLHVQYRLSKKKH